MDAFYASVELLRHPQLRGKAVVIGGRRRVMRGPLSTSFPTLKEYTGRGVITTATYEARAFGVHSGMGLMKVAQLAPDALLLPGYFDEYRRYSRLFKDAVRVVATQIEDRGIDEIYIDLTELVSDASSAVADRAWNLRAGPRDLHPACRARCDGTVVFDRYNAEQVAFEDRV